MRALYLAAVATSLLLGCDTKVGITKIEPNFGSVSGNDFVVIEGNGFRAGMTVRFGERECSSIVVESSTKIQAKTPSGKQGTVDVTVTDPTGKTFVSKSGFTYQAAKQ